MSQTCVASLIALLRLMRIVSASRLDERITSAIQEPCRRLLKLLVRHRNVCVKHSVTTSLPNPIVLMGNHT
jgi:hypothetical protein